MDCDNCKHKTCWEYAEPCSSCTSMTGTPTNWEPQTNADRIRAMSDEELAEWIYQVQDGDAYQKENYLPPLSKSWWIKWLKKEVTENGRRTAEEKV